ncbi:MAG: putative Methyltransferase [Ignavibacteria bacterium]|nr:putative Methyltransferase [Ignavibacteria bacterium]
MKSQEQAEKYILKLDRSFVPRWTVFKQRLSSILTSDLVWVDCGCGENYLINEYSPLAKKAIGVDVIKPQVKDDLFIKADIKSLPFEDNSVDLITLKFVIEHIDDIDNDFRDIVRVLKKDGKLLLITTNLCNPFIALARIIPYKIKNKIITSVFKVKDEDVFPTYHHFNSPGRFKKSIKGLALKEMEFISDINFTNNFVFILFLGWHFITKLFGLKFLRTNIIGVFVKE